MTQDTFDFDSAELIPERDGKRIARQRELVRSFMSDGNWHTLREIAGTIKQPEASVSARLRDFRQKKFGGHEVLRRWMGIGIYEYRVSGGDNAYLGSMAGQAD